MSVALLAYPITGFAIAFCLYFLHAAWLGWTAGFNPYTVRAHGVFGAVFWFAFVGPIVSARIAHIKLANEATGSALEAIAIFSITLLWASMLGILFQETARLAFS
ncbi:MAG: hypothetical protein AAFX98_02955 [Pseudomonadota bacterium]